MTAKHRQTELITAMVKRPRAGGEIEIAAAPVRVPQHGRVIDLMEALKKSMEKTPAREARPAASKKRRSRG